jgi:membrane-associated phospholipid phosphatase
MKKNRLTQTGPVLALAALAAIPLSMAFADRPVAYFMFQHMHESRAPFVLLTHFVDIVEVAAGLLLLWSLWTYARGRAFGAKGRIALRAALAVFVAIGAKDMLKIAFGRTWPETFTCGNPSFIRDDAYGFAPFHGGQGWASFPSGHDMVVFAAAGCLWVLLPRLRTLYVLAAVLVSVGLLVADFHWLSDIVAGGLFGWIIGRFIAQIEFGKVDLGKPMPAI